MEEKFLIEEDLVVNDLRFTSRKVDILSCICNGYTLKAIANVLGISLNTVNTHIDQLFKTTNTCSKEQLARFCEKSSEYNKIQKRYRDIVLFHEFEQVFRKISKLHLENNYIFHVIGQDNVDDSVLITSMKLAGINVQISYADSYNIKDGFINVICLKDPTKLKKEYNNHKILIINNNELFVRNHSNDKYLSHIETLKSILPEKTKGILGDFENSIMCRKEGKCKNKDFWRGKMISLLITIIVSALVIIAVSSFGIKLYFDGKDEIMTNLYYATDNMITRDSLIKEVNKAEKENKNDIKVVVLVGRGGAGKTTIARSYIKNKAANIKLEINAASKQTIIDSFYSIATVIADKKNKQEVLSDIKATPNPEERTKRVINFMQSHLKQLENWYLLFDNIDEMDIVKEYFPVNSEIWGRGVVLITTRNENIGSCDLFPSTNVKVGELSEDEQLQLFCGILYDGTVPVDKIEEIKSLLSKLPKFPLDVSSAAYYMKNTKISFDEYLDCIHSFSEDFERSHKKIISEYMEYDKTRNGIIASMFSKIIQEYPDFKELLLLICLIDSQNIYVRFLEKYKDKIIVQEFVRVLKRFSVVTEQEGIFFIHRSTQNTGLKYILSTLSEGEKIKYIDSVVKAMTPFDDICWFMYKKDLDKYKEGFFIHSISHLEALNNNLNSICAKDAEKYEARIFTALGHIYHMHGNMISLATLNYKKALKIKEIQKYLSKYDYAVLLAMLGYDSTLFGNMEIAKKCLNECYSISKALPDNETLLSIYFIIFSILYERVGDFEKAVETSDKAIKMLEGKEEKWAVFMLVQTYYCVLTYYARHSLNELKKDQCLAYAKKIFNIYNNQLSCKHADNKELAPYPLFACSARFTLAAYHNMLGKYKTSLEEYSLPNEAVIKKYNDAPLSHKCFLESEKNYSLVWLNKPEIAEEKLSDTIEKLKYLENSKILIYSVFYRIEARISLGKLDEAYEDCKFAIDFERWNLDNTSLVRRNTCHYHAAIIKYKQKNYALSLTHFADFFRNMNEFCKTYLEKSAYEKLLKENTFEIIKDESRIKECFQNSLKIFSAIYGENHPFVKDFAYKNQ